MSPKIIVINLLGVLLVSANALALSCAQPSIGKEFERVPYVFKGYVQKMTAVAESGKDMEAQSTAMIDVLESYKKDLPKRVYVSGNAYWGQPFEAGEVYLIFADKKDEKLFIKLCDGSAPFAALDREKLKELFLLSEQFKKRTE